MKSIIILMSLSIIMESVFVTSERVQCPYGEFECDDGRRCYTESEKCDDFQDCYDNSDEDNHHCGKLLQRVKLSHLLDTRATKKGESF